MAKNFERSKNKTLWSYARLLSNNPQSAVTVLISWLLRIFCSNRPCKVVLPSQKLMRYISKKISDNCGF